MTPRLCIIRWRDGSRSYTSETVVERYAALYGKGLDVRRTLHTFRTDAVGNVILPKEIQP